MLDSNAVSVETDDNDIDLFGINEISNDRKNEIRDMFTDETYDMFLNFENTQLRNVKSGRKTSDELAQMIFNMLLRNGFEQITVDHSSVDTPAPCASGEIPSQFFFSWEEFFEDPDSAWNVLYKKSESGDEQAKELFDAALTGLNNFIENYMDNDEYFEFAKKWAKVESERAQAVKACGECPLKAQCLAASITIPTSNGGFTDPSCVDQYGISGGYDFDSREYVHTKVVKLIRNYKKELREDEILQVPSDSEGLTEEQWQSVMNGEEYSENVDEIEPNFDELSEEELVELRNPMDEVQFDDSVISA